MTMQFSDIAARAAADGKIAPEEIQVLRELGWADGRMDPDEAEALFVANDALVEPSRDWCDFFVEALSNFIVHTVEPQGHVDQEMADELTFRIDRDGRVGSLAELELLVRVLEKSGSVPASLRAYALRQIEAAIEQGGGPTRHGELAGSGINATEVALLRRMLFAPGSEGAASVCQAEAELLFRLKDAALYEANAAEWQQLFVQGVANYLLGFAGPEPLDSVRAAELEAFMNAEGAGIGGFLTRMMASDVEDAFGSLLGGADAEHFDWEAEAEAGAELTTAETGWLRDRLDADEELDDYEKALIAFIDAETGETFVPRP
ncbi:hypothetical protein [Novosphingobium ginsenosidimutans]|uniref:Uncharacterized protein n=1 Tax=Novosphingobium ginsenosidimutans TaxID=1176536 RepID=A0A5B8S3T7_9SPHN|nr:hypothetical protein [Novosphingobium ginsenosidimutans]QEA15702.1 hypothetical protein FRF71_05895 [Novosphingobium ginsenosidimutans]